MTTEEINAELLKALELLAGRFEEIMDLNNERDCSALDSARLTISIATT